MNSPSDQRVKRAKIKRGRKFPCIQYTCLDQYYFIDIILPSELLRPNLQFVSNFIWIECLRLIIQLFGPFRSNMCELSSKIVAINTDRLVYQNYMDP